MSKCNERVFIRNARLSYPALDKPRASSFDASGADPKYQATFLISPDNPAMAAIRAAIQKVAEAEFGAKAMSVLQNPEKIPLRSGDAKENVPDGYAGMWYITAKSKNAPELRDANPRIIITGEQAIREKFVAGYYVNGFVDIYPYIVKNAAGAVLKSGIAASLVSVQFCRYADAFAGSAKPAESDYPDCSAEAEASGAAEFAGSWGAPIAAPAQQAAPAWGPQTAAPAPASAWPAQQQAPAPFPASAPAAQQAAPAWGPQTAAPAPAAPAGGMWYPGGEPAMPQQDDLPF
jgi:hypothetical protein